MFLLWQMAWKPKRWAELWNAFRGFSLCLRTITLVHMLLQDKQVMWLNSTTTEWGNILYTLVGGLWCWEGLGARGEGDDRGWDGWMASLTRWTWVWVNSESWWWTGRPGVVRFMGSLGVGHDWETSISFSTFMHWRWKWQPTPVFLPGESQGRESLVGCRLWGSHRVGHDWSDLAAAAAAAAAAHFG